MGIILDTKVHHPLRKGLQDSCDMLHNSHIGG